jgi:hypothetical protein
MNVELAQRAVATVGEFVCLPGADDENVAGAGLPLLTIDGPSGTAFNHVHNLIVIMPVQARSLARLGRNQKKRDTDITMVHANELMGHSYKRQLRPVNDFHGMFDSADH